jgi:hypothetical protein
MTASIRRHDAFRPTMPVALANGIGTLRRYGAQIN